MLPGLPVPTSSVLLPQSAGTSGYINIAYFMAATTVLYLLYSLHTAAYKGSTAGGAPIRGAAPEELVSIVGVAADMGGAAVADGQRGSADAVQNGATAAEPATRTSRTYRTP